VDTILANSRGGRKVERQDAYGSAGAACGWLN
jgi:hypothetical protein